MSLKSRIFINTILFSPRIRLFTRFSLISTAYAHKQKVRLQSQCKTTRRLHLLLVVKPSLKSKHSAQPPTLNIDRKRNIIFATYIIPRQALYTLPIFLLSLLTFLLALPSFLTISIFFIHFVNIVYLSQVKGR